MSNQLPADYDAVDAQPSLPLDSDQMSLQHSTLPAQEDDPDSQPLSQSRSSLLKQRVSAAEAALVFLMFCGLIAVSAGGFALLRSYRTPAPAESSRPRLNEAAPIAQIITATQPAPTVAPTVPEPTDGPAMEVETEVDVPAASTWLTEAQTEYQSAMQARDYGRMERLRNQLSQTADAEPQLISEASTFISQVAYARDTLTGTVYLSGDTMVRWQLADQNGVPLTNPIAMTINDGGVYLLDSGSLYRADLAALPAGGGVLTTTAVLTPGQTISGYPVKEIVALDGIAVTDAVFVLDKSSDIYRFQPSSDQWSLELPLAREYQNPDPFYQNLSTYSERLYMLDPARNQIWRHPSGDLSPEYFASKLPWLLEPGDPDVSSGLDLAIDGNIYVLARDGSIGVFTPAPLTSFAVESAEQHSLVAGLDQTTSQPVAIMASADGITLYVVDPGQRRVVALDRRDGALLRQFMAPDTLDFAYLHSAVENNGWLLLLAASRLYAIDLSSGITATTALTGQMPLLTSLPVVDRAEMQPAAMAPNDPRLPAVIASYGFTMPIQGALLPDRGAIYPGSRRAYRYGVHEGLDIYGRDVGVEISVGTPVVAAADGVILRADTEFQELSPQELNALLENANARHDTPLDSLNLLGGRQIWIDHGDGLVTTYQHLNSIAFSNAVGRSVKAGEVIGTVGVSGTPDGAAGITQFAHLHFEIRLGNEQQYYLGQWLTIEETRRAFERIFQVAVRPAYLEFHQ